MKVIVHRQPIVSTGRVPRAKKPPKVRAEQSALFGAEDTAPNAPTLEKGPLTRVSRPLETLELDATVNGSLVHVNFGALIGYHDFRASTGRPVAATMADWYLSPESHAECKRIRKKQQSDGKKALVLRG